MIKVLYKSMTIEFECLADVITFVEYFNPPDKIDTVFGEEEFNSEFVKHFSPTNKTFENDELKNLENHFKEQMERNNRDNIIDPDSGFTKSEEKLACDHLGITKVTGEDENIVCIYFDDFVTYMYKQTFYAMILTTLKVMPHEPIIPTLKETVEMAKKPKDSKKPMMVTIGSEHIEIGNPPQPITPFGKEMIAGSEKAVPLTEDDFEDIDGKEFVEEVSKKFAESIVKESKKKRGRPKKVTEHDDKVVAKNGKPIQNEENLIMSIDDVAKELSRTKAMLFTEEALRKIFQKAYKPALKTDVKATYPLTQLDPQMCNTFVSEVSNKLGMKCTLSYKVGKGGFTYILMK